MIPTLSVPSLRSTARTFLHLYRTSFKFRLGFTLIVILSIVGFVVPLFSPFDTRAWNTVPKDLPPSFEYPLGTTTIGRDVFWELCASTGKSLIIALVTAVIASHVGLLIGLVAGMRGGLLDRVLMFVSDTFIIIPSFLLLVMVVTIIKPYIVLPLLGAIISIVSWPWPARQVRSMALSLRERTFVHTARLSGMGMGKVLLSELMPHVLGWHLVNFTNTILFSIATEAGLAIFGLSILGDNTLGVMIFWALAYFAIFRGLWWWIAAPVMTLVLIFISFYLVSAGLSEYMQGLTR